VSPLRPFRRGRPSASASDQPGPTGDPGRVRLPPGTWFAVLVLGFGLFELLRETLVATRNPHLVPALLAVGAAVVPVTFVVFVYGRRLAYTVSGGVLSGVAGAGGVVGVIVAGTLEYDALRQLGSFSVLGVALIEEAAKLLVPALVLAFVRRYRLPADGLLLGVASGAGFAVLETMGYAFVALVTSKGDVSTVDGVLAIRGAFSPAAHMAWTGLTCAALAAAMGARSSRPAIAGFGLAFVAAVALHTAWDGIGTVPAYGVLSVISLGLLATVTVRLRTHRSVTGGPSPLATP